MLCKLCVQYIHVLEIFLYNYNIRDELMIYLNKLQELINYVLHII